MRIPKAVSAGIVSASLLALLALLAACGSNTPASAAQEQVLPISVNNDSVDQASSPTVTNTEAGKVLRPVQSSGVSMEAGITAPPEK